VKTRGGLVLAGALVLALGAAASVRAQDQRLRPPGEFPSAGKGDERSRALFVEAGKVLQHPRCVNCHPDGDRPLQGETGHPHQPPVRRGDELQGLGVTTMRCATCHGAANYDPGGVPGDPQWSLARTTMAWQGKTLGQICAQIKDPKRNGGRTVAEVVHHMQHHGLVGWAWAPGKGRQKAPGSWEVFSALVGEWERTGAHCPPP
jgi:hypothetical protein